MTFPTRPASATPTHDWEKVSALALSLAQAEEAIHSFAAGQVDAIMDGDGRPYLLRPAQERLRRSEKQLQAVFDSVGDAILVVDRGGSITFQNQAVTRVLSYGPDALLGANLFQFIHPEDLPQLYSAFFNVIEDFLPEAVIGFRYHARDGSYRFLEAIASKFRDPSAPCVVLACRDITRRGRDLAVPPVSQAASLETSPAKSRFLAMLAHELRTPLMPILLGIDQMEGDSELAGAKLTLAMIRRNLDLESRLLEELSEFTEVGQHKVALQIEAIDAHETLRFALQVCEHEISAAQVRVTLDLRASESRVMADTLKLQQVMWNLIRNAIKFSPEGSKLVIGSVNGRPGELIFDFIDQGIGIEPELLPVVFDPLQQGLHSIQHRYGGLGLGLFIARSLIEAQGGTIAAFSEGLGKGSCFRLTLPTAGRSSRQAGVLPIAPRL